MKKTILMLMLLLSMTLAGCGNGQDATVASSAQDNQDSSDVQTETVQAEPAAAERESNLDFTNLKIEVTEGTLYIRSGDEFTITSHKGEALQDYEIQNGTLQFRSSHTGDTVLTLPENGQYDLLQLTLGAGHIYLEGNLEFQDLKLEVAQGEATLDDISIIKDSAITVKQGSAFLTGSLGETITADCKEGHLGLALQASQTDYNYELTLSNGGNIRFGSENYHNRSLSKTIDNHASQSCKLTCSRGDLSVEIKN